MVQTFDPRKVNVTYNGRQLRMFGDNMFTLARSEASATLKVGVKGDSVYVMNANKSGTLTVTLQQESPDIAFIKDCDAKNVQANLTITDANNGSNVQFSANNCRVEKRPDESRGKEATDVTVVFLIPEILD